MRRPSASAPTLNQKFTKEQQGIVIGNNLAVLLNLFWQSFFSRSKIGLFVYVLLFVCVRVFVYLLPEIICFMLPSLQR